MSYLPYKVTALKDFDATGQNVLAGASVSVLISGGGFASLKTDSTGATPLANPFPCDSNGEKEFYILGGDYEIIVSGGQSWNIKLSGASDIQSIENFAALASTPAPTAGMVVYLKQHTSGGLGGGYFQDNAGAITNDGGTLINNTATAGRHWKRINYDCVTPQMFGAIGNGVVDDRLALQSMLDSGLNIKGGSGYTYKTTNSLFLTTSNVTVDFGGSKIDNKAGSLYAIVMVTSALTTKTEASLLTLLGQLHYGTEIDNSHVENLVVEMSAISSGGSNLGAGIVYGKNCTLRNITVTQTNGNGIELRNSTNCGVIVANLTPRTYGLFNFMTKDCYADRVKVSGCNRGIITKQSQAGQPVNYVAYNCTVENLTETLYYAVGGEFKERVLTDPIYQSGHENVSDVTYINCTFRSTTADVKIDVSYFASRFKFICCKFITSVGTAGIGIGLGGNQIGGDTQGKNHLIDGCTFVSASTLGNICLSVGADTLITNSVFNGSYQRLLRAENEYLAVASFKNNIVSAFYEGSSLLENALLSEEPGARVDAADNEIVLTMKAGTGLLGICFYNLTDCNDNKIKITGSSAYSAYPIYLTSGAAKNNKVTVNGFADVDGITVAGAGSATGNELNHDGTSTGTSRGIRADSGSVQVLDLRNNMFSSGWDTNESATLGINLQFPVYASEAAAAAASLRTLRLYKTSDGIVRVKT